MKSKFFQTLLALLVIVSMLAACAPAATEAPAAEAPVAEAPAAEAPAAEAPVAEAPAEDLNNTKPLIIAIPVDVTTWEPNNISTKTDSNIAEHMFDALTFVNDQLEVEPMLATSWELLDDNVTWRFKLRDDVYFWDGEHFNAETVKYVIERGLKKEEFGWSGNTPGFIFDSLGMQGATVVDEYTVDITLGGFFDDFLVFASEIMMHSVEYYENNPLEVVAEMPNGSGPYKLVEWVRDDHITLERWDDYWGELPLLKTTIYRPIPEASTAVAELLAGGVHVVSKVPPDQSPTIDASGIATTKTVAGGRRVYIGFNQRETGGCYDALKDVRVRQALNMAVDIDTILDSLFYGNGVREGGMVNPPHKAATVQAYPYDPEGAKALLAEAGYADGFGAKCEIGTPNGRYAKDYQIAQAVASYLTEIGIEAEAVPYEWSVYVPMIREKKLPPMFLLGSGSSLSSAWGDLADFANDSTNYVGWNNEEWNTLKDQLGTTYDLAERKVITDRLQMIVNEDAPWLFIYMQVDWYAVNNDVDWSPRADEIQDFKHASWIQ
jgi:peptide/nickel transport system substrate-binding protein